MQAGLELQAKQKDWNNAAMAADSLSELYLTLGEFSQAVAGLREAGTQDHLPRGLLARAAYYRAQNEFTKARADLEEAQEIAERGEMKLFLADYHLEACKLQMASGKSQQAKEHLAIAKEMIEKMGYGRRKPEVEELEREIAKLK
jgi:tetratricopeptide (TPR) repeat protein